MKISEWQEACKKGPKVWVVVVRFEGEDEWSDVYDSEEAAQIDADWRNSRKPKFGHARVQKTALMTLELAKSRFNESSH